MSDERSAMQPQIAQNHKFANEQHLFAEGPLWIYNDHQIVRLLLCQLPHFGQDLTSWKHDDIHRLTRPCANCATRINLYVQYHAAVVSNAGRPLQCVFTPADIAPASPWSQISPDNLPSSPGAALRPDSIDSTIGSTALNCCRTPPGLRDQMPPNSNETPSQSPSVLHRCKIEDTR